MTTSATSRPERHERLARGLHGLVAAVVGLALVAQLVLVLRGGTDVSTGEIAAAVPTPTALFRLVSYFTIQSNLFVLVTAVSLAAAPERDGRLWRAVRLDSLLAIAVTGIVYNTLLAPLVHLHGFPLLLNTCLHVVSPVLTVVVWLVVGPRPRIDGRTVARAFVWPVAWVVGTFVRGAVTGWYPYPFLDAGTLGLPRAVGTTSLVVGLALVLALLLRVLDRRLPATRR